MRLSTDANLPDILKARLPWTCARQSACLNWNARGGLACLVVTDAYLSDTTLSQNETHKKTVTQRYCLLAFVTTRNRPTMNTTNPFFQAAALEATSTLTLYNIVKGFFSWRAEQMAILALESLSPSPSTKPEMIVHNTMYHSRQSCGRSFLGGLSKLGDPNPTLGKDPVMGKGADFHDHIARSRFAKVYLNIGRDIRNNYAPLFLRLRENDISALFRLLEMIYMHQTIKTLARCDNTAGRRHIRTEYRKMVRRIAKTGSSSDQTVIGGLTRDPFRNPMFVAAMAVYKEKYVRTMSWAIEEGEVPGWEKVEDNPASLLAAYALWGQCYRFESLDRVLGY